MLSHFLKSVSPSQVGLIGGVLTDLFIAAYCLIPSLLGVRCSRSFCLVDDGVDVLIMIWILSILVSWTIDLFGSFFVYSFSMVMCNDVST